MVSNLPMRRSILLALALTALAACNENPPSPAPTQAPAQGAESKKSALPDHDPALAKKLVKEGALLIDVRSPDEFGDKHLPGAINIPVEQVQSRLAEVEKLAGGDKKKPIVVYCHSGARSRMAKRTLVRGGFEQVTNMGSIEDWPKG
jgi:phage shock protein E